MSEISKFNNSIQQILNETDEDTKKDMAIDKHFSAWKYHTNAAKEADKKISYHGRESESTTTNYDDAVLHKSLADAYDKALRSHRELARKHAKEYNKLEPNKKYHL